MKYYVFDSMGSLLNSYDTRTGSPAYITADKEGQVGGTGTNTSTGTNSGNTGGDVGAIAKAILPLSTFWTDTSSMPTDYYQMNFVVCQYDQSHAANMAGETTLNSPGYISGLSGSINGPTQGSTCYFQIYKNGQPTGLIASGSSTGPKVDVQTDGASSYSFVKGDVLSVWIRSDNSYVNQSFSATIEVVFTA